MRTEAVFEPTLDEPEPRGHKQGGAHGMTSLRLLKSIVVAPPSAGPPSSANLDVSGPFARHSPSEEEPQYEIRSDKSDHVAVHKGRALTLVNDR